MFFVMVEIANYRQLSRLRAGEAAEIRGLLEHFSLNRGGRLAREQNGFFLFAFHPLREKILEQVSDFLFLTSESLQKKGNELFGYSLLLDQDDLGDEVGSFNRMKTLVFLAPRENRVWASPAVLHALTDRFPVTDEQPLAEILGPPQKSVLPPLSVGSLMEMTGWVEALKTPLSRQLASTGEVRQGKILRLKGSHLAEKYFVLKTVLHQIYRAPDDFPVFFPLEDSRDVLSQLLARVDLDRVADGPKPDEPAWEALLNSRGGGDFPGDSGREDVVGALNHYFRILVRHLGRLGLPPVFVFLVPQRYEPEAQAVLESILGALVATDGVRLLLLESHDRGQEFLGRQPSLSWSFPPLSAERIVRERDSRGWQDRFPVIDKSVLETCGTRGMAWVHHLWGLQEGTGAVDQEDPSWTLFKGLDSSHHKVYYVLWAARGLLEETQLVDFFQGWGEDAAVIEDKVRSLGNMGFFLGGLSRPLRSDFGKRLESMLGEEGRELLGGLGEYLYRQWSVDHRLSEVLFSYLRDWGLPGPSLVVLNHYLTNKINQGQGDFLPLLRTTLWETAPTEELQESYRLVAAASKLRFSLNWPGKIWEPGALDRFRRNFTRKTEDNPTGEWLLQLGRYNLRAGDLNTGFSWMKKALAEAQVRDDRALEVRAELEIGLTLLRRHRVEEGREYFEIASRLAEKTGSTYLITMTAALDAMSLFLLGHLNTADQVLTRGLASCDRGGLRQWKVFLLFLKARLVFDLGDYTGAIVHLNGAAAVADKYQLSAAKAVVTAWKGRAEAYSGNGPEAFHLLESLDPTAETGYFLAETAYLDRDYTAALVYLEGALGRVAKTQPFGSGEQVDWLSGYAGIEDRALEKTGDIGVLQNQLEAFSLLVKGLLGNQDATPVRFSEILARKGLLELDPVSGQYYYWYYLILSKHDSRQEAQRLTLLGRCLKDFQVRSSRIEDPLQRQDYLTRSYWNSQAAVEARKLKLL